MVRWAFIALSLLGPPPEVNLQGFLNEHPPAILAEKTVWEDERPHTQRVLVFLSRCIHVLMGLAGGECTLKTREGAVSRLADSGAVELATALVAHPFHDLSTASLILLRELSSPKFRGGVLKKVVNRLQHKSGYDATAVAFGPQARGGGNFLTVDDLVKHCELYLRLTPGHKLRGQDRTDPRTLLAFSVLANMCNHPSVPFATNAALHWESLGEGGSEGGEGAQGG